MKQQLIMKLGELTLNENELLKQYTESYEIGQGRSIVRKKLRKDINNVRQEIKIVLSILIK